MDDAERIETWQRWLRRDAVPKVTELSDRERRLFRMLLAQVLDQVVDRHTSIAAGAKLLWTHPQIRSELVELLDVLATRIPHVSTPLEILPDVTLRVHARYTRLEMLAACGVGTDVKVMSWQAGVLYRREIRTDLFAFTLDKTSGQFSPTTRYRDYAISQELIHWESQSVTRADSDTGRRYQEHASRGTHVLLFARLRADDRAFYFLGPASYVSHVGEKPMAITWRLQHRLPGDLFQAFAAAVA